MAGHNVLVIGSGGREHALAWALSRSPQVQQVFVAPGNAGTEWPANEAAVGLQPRAASRNVPISAGDFPALVRFARENGVSLTVIGPEAPLAAGIVDVFRAAGLHVFGPTQAAALLEASKAFCKVFMRAHGIPTADYGMFTDYETACDFLNSFAGPVVVKADGLAAGKGVLVCDTQAEAEAALRHIMQERAFGAAGDQVVIEERLTGREISVLAFTDGKTIVPMPVARDHKRALDGDLGLNTGGMGAFAPTQDVPQALIDEVVEIVLRPAVDGMAAQGTPYVGVLYAGLMLTDRGPMVLEFNCRFGDPETQVILPLLKTDLYEIFDACVEGRLHELSVEWHSQTCAAVVAASPGYPDTYPTGLPISGLDALAQREDVIVFHAGTARQDEQIVTSGGRVLAVSALGDELRDALARAYSGMATLHFEGMHYRRDIGKTHVEGAR
jgi:phosphoribosylamine--glycine ligase